jgi:predicted nucleotidyltransferase
MKKPDRAEIIIRLKAFFHEQADPFGIDMAFLYGSWAKGFPRFDSDLDVAVIFNQSDLSEEEAFDRIADISLRLIDSLRMEVNVLQIHRDTWKPMLYYNVIVMGVPVYVRSDAQYSNLINEAIFQMEDFSIFGLKWQYEAAKTNLELISPRRQERQEVT